MKKALVIFLAVVMLLSLVPAVVSAEDLTADGPFLTLYDAQTADKEDPNKKNYDKSGNILALAGYKYTENGFSTISPTYTKTSKPFAQLAATLPFDLTKNNDVEGNHVLSVTFTVDAFAYKGTNGADEWICISITDHQASTPGAPKFQDGLFILMRGSGNGSAQMQPSLDVGSSFETKTAKMPSVNLATTEDGKEIYTFYVDYAEGHWTLSYADKDGNLVDATPNTDSKTGGKNLDQIFEGFKDKAYFQITTQTGYVDSENPANNKIELTVNKYNGMVPMANDSKDPISDGTQLADFIDEKTIAENTPALIWDKTKSSFSDYEAPGYAVTENADGTIHMKKDDEGGNHWLMWGIKSSISVRGTDFPYVVMLSNITDSSASNMIGTTYYCGGDDLTPNDSHTDSSNFDIDLGGGWKLTVLDGLAYKWDDGRINCMRIHFNNSEFDIAWIGCFRSEKEATAYATEYLKAKGIEVTTQEATTRKPRTTKAVTTAAPSPDTTAAPEETKAAEKSGCKSTVAMIAVVPAIAAAYVFTKKKHD